MLFLNQTKLINKSLETVIILDYNTRGYPTKVTLLLTNANGTHCK